jgi:DNA (cytosine-5)-methyltransferase 1
MYSVIDLFCGAGGLTRGLVDTGQFRSVLGNDIDEDSVASYEANFGKHGRHHDLNELLNAGVFRPRVADLVVGGPPCQGFSLLNKQRQNDERRGLWRAYYRVLELVQPLAFVMENVPELLKSPEFLRFRRMAVADLGFTVWADVLNAADYGVPQRRRRAIVIGIRGAEPILPRVTHYDPSKFGALIRLPNLEPWRTVREAIGDLKPPSGTEIRDVPPPYDLHFGRNPTEQSMQRYRLVGEGENRFDLMRKAPHLTPGCWIRKKTGGTDLFGRLWWDRPAFTIRTEFFKPEKGRYLHPQQHRPITHREAARLQSFPDDHVFVGSKISIARQIGNAVPPRLAAAIGAALVEALAATRKIRRGARRVAYSARTDVVASG